MKTVKLATFIENPDNPQTVTAEDFALLVESLRTGRIAYVADGGQIVSLLTQCRDILVAMGGKGIAMKERPIVRKMSFMELSKAYLEYSKNKVKPSTLSTYENLLIASPFAKSLMNREVSELTRPTVQLWIDSFEEHTSYIHNFIIVFRSMIAWARDRDICALPDEYSKPFKFKRMVHKGGSKEIDEDDYEKITKLINDNISKDRKYAAVFVALKTGMRIGEICGLKKEDVDPGKSLIHIRHTLRRNYSPVAKKTEVTITEPKSKSSLRDIPVSKSVIDACLMHDSKGETLFGVEPRELLDFYTRMQGRALCKNRYTFHSLRHTFVSREIRAGKNPKAVSKYVGHGKIDITLAVYTHVSQNDLKEVANG